VPSDRFSPCVFAAFCAALAQLDGDPLDVLEIGSRPGHLALDVVGRCRVRSYVALDFSDAMHQLARGHLGEMADRVTFLQRDFRDANWTVGLGLFDAVVTMQAAHETRHKRHLVPTLGRVGSVLKPGGLLLYCDHYTEVGSNKNPSLYMARQDQAGSIRDAGFSDVRTLHDEGGMALYAARPLRIDHLGCHRVPAVELRPQFECGESPDTQFMAPSLAIGAG